MSRKLPRDCGQFAAEANKVEFVGISFNSSTPIDSDNVYLSRLSDPTLINSLPVLVRIYFCLFTKASLKFEEFISMLENYFLQAGNVVKFKSELKDLMHRRFYDKGKIVVLLFDELTKIDVVVEYQKERFSKPISDYVRSFVCKQSDQNEYLSICLLSVLNMDVISASKKVFTPSGRTCENVGSLKHLSQSQTNSLFSNILSKLELTRTPVGKPRSANEEYLLRDLYYLSGGHPRTIDVLIKEISRSKGEAPLQQYISEILGRDLQRLPQPAWDVIQAVLLSKNVAPEDFLPNSKRCYNIAIANGELIESLSSTDISFLPQVSELQLFKWAFKNTASTIDVQREIADELMKISKIRYNFSAVSVEDVLMGREYIVSRLYCSQSLSQEYGNISMKKLYPRARFTSSMMSDLDVKINASKPLKYSTEEEPPDSTYNALYKPVYLNNAGFDFRIRYSLAENEGKFLDVYYQVKFSEDNATTSLQFNELLRNYKNCASIKAHPKSAGFLVVFMTWRNGGERLNVPPGCLLLHKVALKDTVGPNFSNFIETLTSNPILLGPKVKVLST